MAVLEEACQQGPLWGFKGPGQADYCSLSLCLHLADLLQSLKLLLHRHACLPSTMLPTMD